MSKLIRVSDSSWKTLTILSKSSHKDVKIIVDEWATSIQDCLNDEVCKDSSKVELVTFRKGKTLIVASVIVPQKFFCKLTKEVKEIEE